MCLGAEEVTRDFAYGEADPLIRRCRLLPWVPADMLGLGSCTPEPPDEHYQVGPFSRDPPPLCLFAWWLWNVLHSVTRCY